MRGSDMRGSDMRGSDMRGSTVLLMPVYRHTHVHRPSQFYHTLLVSKIPKWERGLHYMPSEEVCDDSKKYNN